MRKRGAQLVKARKAEEVKIISSITNLSSKDPDSLTEEEKEDLAYSQNKPDELYYQKAKGAFTRSRSKWLEEGEQNSHYFFNLEKHHSANNNISKLNIDGVITQDRHDIADFCAIFCKVLYSSKFSQTATDNLLNSLSLLKKYNKL